MERLKNEYLSLNSAVRRDLNDLVANDISYIKSFSRAEIDKHRVKLQEHNSSLESYDSEYMSYITTQGAIGDLNALNAKLGLLEKARATTLQSLSEYQRIVLELEARINFNVTTAIALSALVLSILGIIFNLINYLKGS